MHPSRPAPCCPLLTFTALAEKGGWHPHHPRDALPQPPSSEDQTPASFQPNCPCTHTLGAEREPLPRRRCCPGATGAGQSSPPTALGRGGGAPAAWHRLHPRQGLFPRTHTHSGHSNRLHRVKRVCLHSDDQQKSL